MNSLAHSAAQNTQRGAGQTVLVPMKPTDAMLDAARGLIMSLSFGVPNYETSLNEVAHSGFYGELWRDILTDHERQMKGPLTKAHRAQLIWRAMLAAAPSQPGMEPLQGRNELKASTHKEAGEDE